MTIEAARFDLIAFDIDGTLVEHADHKTVWEVLNLRFTGDDSMNRERYAAYLEGTLSYAEWVALDISGWRDAGARRDDIVAALEPLKLVGGTRDTLAALHEHGSRLVVISGTLDIVLDTLLPDHPFDEVYCNRIQFADNGRILAWSATPFDMNGKSVALKAIAMRESIPLSRVAFVGDSANDVWIAREAGFTVALNPKSDELEQIADAVVRSRDARDILPHLLRE
jgi:phosphoserine phosphatase